jgi:hypothetical protein
MALQWMEDKDCTTVIKRGEKQQNTKFRVSAKKFTNVTYIYMRNKKITREGHHQNGQTGQAKEKDIMDPNLLIKNV